MGSNCALVIGLLYLTLLPVLVGGAERMKKLTKDGTPDFFALVRAYQTFQ